MGDAGLAEAELEAVLASAMDAVVAVDEAQRIILFNAAAERMLGCRGADALGGPVKRFIPPRFHRQHDQAVGRFARSGSTTRRIGVLRDVVALRADGIEFPVEVSLSRAAVGGRRIFVVILRDVTERRRAAQSMRLLATLVESSDDAIIGWALDGGIRSWNRGAEQIYGYAADEILGQPISRLVPSERRAELAEIRERLGRGESVRHLRTVRLARDGRRIEVSLTLSPTRDHVGGVEGVSSIGRDITAERASERALREAERRMRAAQELAAIGTLTAGLAHEVGTPMNVILGYAQLLEAAAPEEGVRQTARTIVEQVRRVTGIIETLLNIARPHDRRRVSVDLASVLSSSLAFLSERLSRRGITVDREEEPVPALLGDPERLQQLFLNLVLNAADAMPGGGQLRIELRAPASGQVEVRIRDTGTGISEEALPQIFEPFFSTKAKGAGTGLGLAVCKGIVLDHEGEIDVRSELGKGSEFLIRFPAGEEAEARE